jgi:PAS domain S-box-containing protein
MIMIRETGQIELVNTQAEQLFGYTREELLGQPIEMLLPERFRRNHAALRAGFFAAPIARPMGLGRDLYGRRKDASEFPLEIGLSPIDTDEGTLILSTVVDLSERMRTAHALAQSEAEFRASFEAAAVGKILTLPSTRQIVRANRAFARMLGLAPEDLVGRTCQEFTWHEDVAPDAADYRSWLTDSEGAVVREVRFVRSDGSPFWVRTSARVARAAGDGDNGIMVWAIEDIDTRYRAEAALKEAKQTLEQVVEERTQALNQRDLLLREVYHRVKNNLQLVDSLLMLQGRKIIDAQARSAVLSLRQRVYALGLVHQQLMGSSDLKTFEVEPFLEELLTNLMDAAGRSDVRLSVETCQLNIGLDVAIPLGLIVTELVTNSLKHAFPQGAGTVSVILRRDAGQILSLIVADNGIGQQKRDTADDHAGLGTGIIGRLVDQLEGNMTTRVENGSTTEIRFAQPGEP